MGSNLTFFLTETFFFTWRLPGFPAISGTGEGILTWLICTQYMYGIYNTAVYILLYSHIQKSIMITYKYQNHTIMMFSLGIVWYVDFSHPVLLGANARKWAINLWPRGLWLGRYCASCLNHWRCGRHRPHGPRHSYWSLRNWLIKTQNPAFGAHSIQMDQEKNENQWKPDMNEIHIYIYIMKLHHT